MGKHLSFKVPKAATIAMSTDTEWECPSVFDLYVAKCDSLRDALLESKQMPVQNAFYEYLRDSARHFVSMRNNIRRAEAELLAVAHDGEDPDDGEIEEVWRMFHKCVDQYEGFTWEFRAKLEEAQDLAPSIREKVVSHIRSASPCRIGTGLVVGAVAGGFATMCGIHFLGEAAVGAGGSAVAAVAAHNPDSNASGMDKVKDDLWNVEKQLIYTVRKEAKTVDSNAHLALAHVSRVRGEFDTFLNSLQGRGFLFNAPQLSLR